MPFITDQEDNAVKEYMVKALRVAEWIDLVSRYMVEKGLYREDRVLADMMLMAEADTEALDLAWQKFNELNEERLKKAAEVAND